MLLRESLGLHEGFLQQHPSEQRVRLALLTTMWARLPDKRGGGIARDDADHGS